MNARVPNPPAPQRFISRRPTKPPRTQIPTWVKISQSAVSTSSPILARTNEPVSTRMTDKMNMPVMRRRSLNILEVQNRSEMLDPGEKGLDHRFFVLSDKAGCVQQEHRGAYVSRNETVV